MLRISSIRFVIALAYSAVNLFSTLGEVAVSSVVAFELEQNAVDVLNTRTINNTKK
jgi:hypothetical protein